MNVSFRIASLALLAAFALAVSGNARAWSSDDFGVGAYPRSPTELDVVYVHAYFGGGAFVNTHSAAVSGNTVNVRLVQDGLDFSPNPVFDFRQDVGRLPAGTYSVVVSVERYGSVPDVRTMTLIVSPAQPRTVIPAIEFYSAALDHYFVSANPREIADLDSGVHPGWTRTGWSFNVLASATSDSVPVCRYYITPQYGDSHFLTAFFQECAALGFDNFMRFLLGDFTLPRYFPESDQVFYVSLPDTASGACPAATRPVYRLWNARPDSGHRYTTDAAVKADMIVRGYIPEGYGPDAVAMCSPDH